MAINYPTSLDSFTDRSNGQTIDASHINDLQDAVEQLEGRVGISSDELIVASTKMLFYADTAPANWTIDDSLDDKLVFVTKGSGASGETGGGAHSTGTWTQPGHVLTKAEIPAHVHGESQENRAAGGSAGYGGTGTDGATEDGQNDGLSSPADSHNHGSTWRPAAYCFIICSKDAYPLSS